MSEERGEIVREVKLASLNLKVIILFLFLPFFILATIEQYGRDSIEAMSVSAFCIFLALIVLIYIFIDRNKVFFTIYTNGIESKSFSFSGNSFLCWSEVSDVYLDSLKARHITVWQLFFLPFEPYKYWDCMPFWQKLFANHKRHSPLGIIVSHCDIAPRELRQNCYDAMSSYHEKHGIKD